MDVNKIQQTTILPVLLHKSELVCINFTFLYLLQLGLRYKNVFFE